MTKTENPSPQVLEQLHSIVEQNIVAARRMRCDVDKRVEQSKDFWIGKSREPLEQK